MTGMWNFNFSLCLISIASFAGAAEITFIGNQKLSGESISMDEDGTVTLETPYAFKPLKIHPEGIDTINFKNTTATSSLNQHSLTLINGDSFPVKISSLDDKVLKIQSSPFGQLEISRDFINSINIGVSTGKTIVQGPGKITDWKYTKPNLTSWQVENDTLISNGSGVIYRDIGLPQNYAIRFKINWEVSPTFELSFSDPLNYQAASTNRYFFRLNDAGITLMRESTGRQRYYRMANIERKPSDFINNQVWVEIRVNRKSGNIALYLNNRLEGKYDDKSTDSLTGKGISFSAYASPENKTMISDLEIKEWFGEELASTTEDRGNAKEDALIVGNGERSSGNIISMTDGGNGLVLRFKSTFQDDAIDFNQKDISTVFFAKKPGVETPASTGTLLHIEDQGVINISKCVFNNDSIRVTHPLLGEIEFDRDVVSSIDRVHFLRSKTSENK